MTTQRKLPPDTPWSTYVDFGGSGYGNVTNAICVGLGLSDADDYFHVRLTHEEAIALGCALIHHGTRAQRELREEEV